ncbi:MAG: GIY-YIG nuclease family protein [Candidatus Kaiserbacteria bacterium]|nr:GIY-YIG nuclease family protein [Candidatus Kaiserbacteria bacterium]
MQKKDIDFTTLPEMPGVYLFRDTNSAVLYVGRATDLRGRVRSYFSNRLVADRGQRIAEAVERAEHIETVETDSVLDAYILEANLIKKHHPPFNVVDKDNKSFQYVGITKEDFPRVLLVRGRQLEQGTASATFSHTFGPFPRGAILKEALRILRKILPFRDRCTPHTPESKRRRKKCFQAQLGLCPGVCDGTMDKEAYRKRMREIRMFLSGNKKQLLRMLEKDMKAYAREQEFEKAEEVRRRIFALQHIQDVSLLKKDVAESSTTSFRIEAYDVAHTAGTQAVGVMVVCVDGEPAPSEYRVFTIRNATEGDDVGALREIVSRRLGHPEWQMPNLIVVDGGKAQRNATEAVLRGNEVTIPVVSVVKTEKHTPRELLGSKEHTQPYEKNIIAANAEAHRFAIARHRKRRSKEMFQ